MAGNLKNILYRREELLENGRIPLFTGRLFRDLMRRDISLINLSDLWKDKNGNPWEELGEILEESLLIAARDETLRGAKHLPLAVLAQIF